MAKKSNYYIDNKQFLASMIEYRKACKDAEEADEVIPSVPVDIGRALFDIANGLSKRPNFSGYSYREDMVMDAVENSLKAIRNFDPEKSSNPFGYFTRISWFAFLRTIKKENKHETLKFDIIQSAIHDAGISKDNYFSILKNKGFVKNIPVDEIKELKVFDEIGDKKKEEKKEEDVENAE